MGLRALVELAILPQQGRRHVQHLVPARGGGQALGEDALAAAGAAQDERADGYSSSLSAATSRSLWAALRTAARK